MKAVPEKMWSEEWETMASEDNRGCGRESILTSPQYGATKKRTICHRRELPTRWGLYQRPKNLQFLTKKYLFTTYFGIGRGTPSAVMDYALGGKK